MDGRIDLEEFTERLDLAYRSTTQTELADLTTDLGGEIPSPPATPRRWFFGIFGGSTIRGRWRVGDRVTVLNVFGGTDLDLGRALVSGNKVTVTVISIFGGSDVIVPEGSDVEMTGGALFGGNGFDADSPVIPGAPRIEVRVYSLFGGTDVKDRPRVSLRERRGFPPPPR